MGKGIWDDPEWRKLTERISTRKVYPSAKTISSSTESKKPVEQPQNNSHNEKKVHISLNLTIPKAPKLPKFKIPTVDKRYIFTGVAVLLVGLSLVIGQKLLNRQGSDDKKDVLSQNITEPDFDTVLPDGKMDGTSDNKVGYDPQRKVASFRDNLGTAVVVVSQQPLPEPFRKNPDDEVKKLAEGFNANEVISTSSPKAYIGKDVSGAQTVILHKKDLLIFIFSNKEVERDLWAEYITRLL